MNILMPFESGMPVLGQASSGNSDLWGTVPAWLAAIGTIGAVFFALYLNLFRANRRRPVLSLDYQPGGEMDLAVTAVLQFRGGSAVQTPGAYLRFRVGNEQGKEAAEDVEVVISSITKDGDPPELLSISNIPLVWSNMEPGTTTRRIPGGTERYIDVLSIVVPAPTGGLSFEAGDTKSEPPPEPLTLDLQITPVPISNAHRLEPSQYTIRLEATARNANATRWETQIGFDGKWEDATNAPSGFTVSKPTRIRRNIVR